MVVEMGGGTVKNGKHTDRERLAMVGEGGMDRESEKRMT